MAIKLMKSIEKLKAVALKVTIVAGAAARARGHRFGFFENVVRDLPDRYVCSSLPSRRRRRREERFETDSALLPVVASLSNGQLPVSVAESSEDTPGTLSHPLPSPADIPRSTHEQSPRR